MHVSRGIDIVGGWFFTLTGEMRPAGDLLHQLVQTLSSASGVLAEAGLLSPQLASLRTWLSNPTGEPRPGPELSVSVTAGWEVQRLSRQLIETAAAQGFSDVIPRRILLTGPGSYLDAAGIQHTDPHLCELQVWDNGTDITTFLSVHSDVWLPYDLAAQPQPALAARNAPRLAQVLADLHDALHVEPQPYENSPHAQVTSYGLDNLYDIDGEVMATVKPHL